LALKFFLNVNQKHFLVLDDQVLEFQILCLSDSSVHSASTVIDPSYLATGTNPRRHLILASLKANMFEDPYKEYELKTLSANDTLTRSLQNGCNTGTCDNNNNHYHSLDLLGGVKSEEVEGELMEDKSFQESSVRGLDPNISQR
jgi:hypothetical protein